MNQDLSQRCMDEVMRVDQIIWLGGALLEGDALPDNLQDFLDDTAGVDFLKLFPKLPPDYVDDDMSSEDRVMGLMDFNYFGFLVEVSTPCMTSLRGDAWSYSWGHHYVKWVYAETLEEALELGFKWVESMRNTEKERA